MLKCLSSRWLPIGFFLALVSRAFSAPDDLLSEKEIAFLERENEMWRNVDPGHDVTANLRHLKIIGFTDEETRAIEPAFRILWDVGPGRNYGWLSAEAASAIKRIDNIHVPRMREARLFQHTGIRLGGASPEDVFAVDQAWRNAIISVLRPNELSEFRLMNSQTAEEVKRIAGKVPLTDDEQRTFIIWTREFESDYPAPPPFEDPHSQRRQLWLEARLDLWVRLRTLLGDHRFASYLMAKDSAFAEMHKAVLSITSAEPAVILELWRIRCQNELFRARNPITTQKMFDGIQSRAKMLLGEKTFGLFCTLPEAKWLIPQPTRRISR